jgi:hypothetical protein
VDVLTEDIVDKISGIGCTTHTFASNHTRVDQATKYDLATSVMKNLLFSLSAIRSGDATRHTAVNNSGHPEIPRQRRKKRQAPSGPTLIRNPAHKIVYCVPRIVPLRTLQVLQSVASIAAVVPTGAPGRCTTFVNPHPGVADRSPCNGVASDVQTAEAHGA